MEDVEIYEVAQIVWKGIVWKAAYGQLSVKELLTILKGFGPMEVVRFEKPGSFRGELSLSLSPEGTKEITLYHLEVLEPRRRGYGRDALAFLRSIFRGVIHVEDAEIADHHGVGKKSQRFWIKMLDEGLIDSLNADIEGNHFFNKEHDKNSKDSNCNTEEPKFSNYEC